MKHIGLIIITLIALLAVGVVSAEPVFDGQLSGIGANDTKDFTADDSYTAYGGNITNFDVDIEIETYHWVGFWGSVTYTLVLEGTGENGFYTWGPQNASAGTVMFSPSTNVDWGSLSEGTVSELEDENGDLSLSTAVDNMTNTFTITNTALLNLSGREITSGTSVSLNTSSNENEWETVLITDGVTVIYATPIDAGNNNYAGVDADFQTMVPINATTSSRTYYVYLSIDPTA